MSKNESILNQKVNEFIEWYYNNKVKEKYLPVWEYRKTREMRNLIEKVAVWYELKYPDYEVNRLMPCMGQEFTDINNVMFRNNPYINDLLVADNKIKELDWDEFYSAEVFIKSLPWEERKYLMEPRYPKTIYLNPDYSLACFHLDKDGFVEFSKYVGAYTKFIFKDEELVGFHIKEVWELFKEYKITLPENNEIETSIKMEFREHLLDCIMYRIIERGGYRIGPRRAFLFAKEFDRNIDIPMIYGIDLTDPGLRLFINEYLKAGGSKDLECFIDYFSGKKNLDTRTIQDLLLTKGHTQNSFYTPEENELYQRLVNALAGKQKKLKKL